MLSEGDVVPDFTLRSTNGTFTLSEAVKDSSVLLYFFPVINGKTCTEYISLMNERADDFKRAGVRMIHINDEPLENHFAWIEHTGSKFEDLSDEEKKVCRMFDALIERAKNPAMIGRTNRAFFLIDRNMVVKYAWRAYMPMDTVPINELLERITPSL